MKIHVLDASAMGDDSPIDRLAALGELTVYSSTSPDELVSHLSGADVAVFNKVRITREAMEASPSLRLLCVFATGYDNIDLAAAKEKGIAVCNVPGYSTDSVALITVSTVLSLVTHLKTYTEYVESGKYTASGVANLLSPTYHELRGKTWGILGYGNIGKAVARVADAFGCRVIVHKRTPVSDRPCVDLDTLLTESDILTIHCPLNDGTRGIIDAAALSKMKAEAILVNEARGAVLNESAVADAILAGKLGGFGCDVYSVEPFPKDHPYAKIAGKDNVVLTPHAAWGAYEARERCIEIILENIRAFYDGKIQNRVDK